MARRGLPRRPLQRLLDRGRGAEAEECGGGETEVSLVVCSLGLGPGMG